MARCLCWIVLVSLACGSAWAQPTPTTAAQGPITNAPLPGDYRVWFEPGTGDGAGRASIILDCSGSQAADAPVDLKGVIRAERPVGKVTLRFDVSNSEGASVYRGATETSLDKEEGVFHFEWDASPFPPGSYAAHFELLRPPGISIVHRDYTIRKASLSELQARFDSTERRLSEAKDRLRGLEDTGVKPPYLRMRIAIAGDYIKEARNALDAKDWPRADSVIRYIETTVETVQAQLVFGKSAPELWDAVAKPSQDAMEIRDGSFVAEGRPLFLIGAYLGDAPSAEELARIAGYGLNFATFSFGPSQTLASAADNADFRSKLDPVFSAALENRMAIMVSLAPQTMPSWAVEEFPLIAAGGAATADVTQPDACQIIERHVKTLVPYLAQQKALDGIALMENPSFKFTGEDIRLRFMRLVKEQYGDRHALNKAWKGLFADMDEVEIGWNRVNPRYQESSAYRYDWQTFHQRLGTEYTAWLRKMVRDASDKPLMMAVADNVFAAGEAESGVDRETLLTQLDLNAVCASNGHTSPYYALEYPKSLLVYTWMRSMAPAKPVVNFDGMLTAEQASENPCSFNYIHTAVWEAAMSGMNALALRAELDALRPESIEGYATACLDLNRLAPVVTAFQQAPAEVAIFWSMPSKIYNNGSPHLESVGFAYEGCSFSGYKIRFVTEKQCVETQLADVKVLVLPDSPAVSNDAFRVLKEYMSGGAAVVRTSFSILYDEYGHSRRDIISGTRHTVLVRGQNLPTEYLHAMDAVSAFDVLPKIPRTINASGYPIEGVKSRYLVSDGQEYLYVVSLRKERIMASLYGGPRSGRDLIHACDVSFPMKIDPLVPMLIRLDKTREKPKS